MKKKWLALVLAAAMLTTMLTGCTDTTEGEDTGSAAAEESSGGTAAEDAEGGEEESADAGDAVRLDRDHSRGADQKRRR